jgi:hypothetical protein
MHGVYEQLGRRTRERDSSVAQHALHNGSRRVVRKGESRERPNGCPHLGPEAGGQRAGDIIAVRV